MRDVPLRFGRPRLTPWRTTPLGCEHAPLAGLSWITATPCPEASLVFAHSRHPPWKSSSAEHSSAASQRQKVHSLRTTAANASTRLTAAPTIVDSSNPVLIISVRLVSLQ